LFHFFVSLLGEQLSSFSQRWSKVLTMNETKILDYLRKYGQSLDYEIAAAIGIKRADVRTCLADLSSRGEISTCTVTRFDSGKPIEGIQCRLAGSIPISSPGRKPGAAS
jgi:DNA-binding MarR family transcriptional regulator